jgi:pre-mRNA-splicing factor SYF2
MSTTLKRKITPPTVEEASELAAPSTPEVPQPNSSEREETSSAAENGSRTNAKNASTPSANATIPPPAPSQSERVARFKALQSRASASQKSNLAEARAEASRNSVDPSVLANLSRKSAIASHNLLKADTEEEGGRDAFERKRAWDYTVEESERWDERMEKKARNRDNVAFQDYSQEAEKIYERQIRNLEKQELKGEVKNREEYEASKAALIEKAAQSGGLEIVETESGELVAIDKDGTFYSTSDSVDFVESRPKRENVDRLVKDLQKAEEVKMKRRRDRLGADANDGDVTYINDKNKQFNQKLARFYDKYTGDIRESFERGTAI